MLRDFLEFYCMISSYNEVNQDESNDFNKNPFFVVRFFLSSTSRISQHIHYCQEKWGFL